MGPLELAFCITGALALVGLLRALITRERRATPEIEIHLGAERLP